MNTVDRFDNAPRAEFIASSNGRSVLALRPLFLWVFSILLLVLIVRGKRPWEDGIVFSLLVIATGAGKRSVALLLTVMLTWASEPAVQWPTYWFTLTPLVWLWHQQCPIRKCMWEGLMVGLAMGWIGGPFMRDSVPALSLLPYVFCCLLFGLQWIGIALALRLTQSFPPVIGALVAALSATVIEIAQAVYGLPWVFLALALPAAPSPLAQWAQHFTIFGVSFLLYLLNFLWFPDLRPAGIRRWLPPAAAAVLGIFAWFGGEMLAALTDPSPLTFSAMIVQPYSSRSGESLTGASNSPPETLSTVTQAALASNTTTDLVIWPETAVPGVDWPAAAGRMTDREQTAVSEDRDVLPQIGCNQVFDRHLLPDLDALAPNKRRTALLLGAPVKTSRSKRYNSACLIRPDGSLARHDKLVLVWTERPPPALDFPWFRDEILPHFGITASYTPGEQYSTLSFNTRNGRRVRIAVSICYEMYFPWLPQFREACDCEAVVHLSNEVWASGDATLSRYENWACQYRAIETRRWQLLCTSMGNSAVIDPRGSVRDTLGGNEGILRTCTEQFPTSPGGAEKNSHASRKTDDRSARDRARR